VRVAVAASKGVARAAAQAHDVAVVPAGGESAFLANLPIVTALRTFGETPESVELGERLRHWGIGTLGALAGLPPGEIQLRLGPPGARLLRLAAGRDDEPFLPSLPPDALEEGTELDYPIHEIEPLSFVLRALFELALDRLACRGLACAGVTLRLKLDPRGFDVRDLPLAAPTREAKTLIEHLRLDLARRPPGAPVVGASILMLPARVRGVELDFFRPAGPAPEKLAATLAHLAALVGAENVGAPAEVDTYREEAVAVRPFPIGAANPVGDLARTATGDPARAIAPVLGFRRFRPPHPVEVLMNRDGPTALRGPQIAARILVAAGPYRSSGEWWHGDGFSRDHWDVHASDGAVYRLHQDRRDACWYIDGYYD
jgi:protein ImuB